MTKTIEITRCIFNVVNAKKKKRIASAGNRTLVARVAGEHSTTEPPMRYIHSIETF